MLKAILISLFVITNATTALANVTCVQGNFKIQLGKDDEGRESSANFTFIAKLPNAQTSGRFTSTLLNGNSRYVLSANKISSGNRIERMSQFIQPDDLAIVERPTTYRCPCWEFTSTDSELVFSIEMNPISQKLSGGLTKYFNANSGIEFTNLKRCQ